MNDDEIVTFCQEHNATIIYLAIGSAHNPQQQYPRFMSDFEGKQICILVDPHLESPPRAFEEFNLADAPIVTSGARRPQPATRMKIGSLCHISRNWTLFPGRGESIIELPPA